MEDLFSNYETGVAFDEMFEAPGVPRRAAAGLFEILRTLSPSEFDERSAERDRSFRDRGITFQLLGEERPFPLDPVPRLVPASDWKLIERGVIQRVRALEMFLADAYGRGDAFNDSIVPRRLLSTSRHFHRQAFGIEPANGVRVHVSGIDLVRDGNGDFCVLEDNLRVPSGVSYVVENRRAMARMFPELFATHHIRPVADYPARLLNALLRSAPVRTRTRPAIAVLTPGVHNSAYFEHSFLAGQMGVELVEGRDLVCRDNVVFMRTTEGERRLDVVYRRVDDDYLDPVQFRPDSALGCAGMVNAARAGNLTIANAIGNGVADDKLVYTYVPELIAYYLGERPVLPNVTTYRIEDEDVMKSVLERIDELVLKPTDASGGYGIVMGPQASDEELAQAATAIQANPRNWIAQEVVTLSTLPTRSGPVLEPRHIDLRPFAINDGEQIWVLPGGLTRVALRRGTMVVNSSQGGGSKDTWVLADEGRHPSSPNDVIRSTASALVSSPVDLAQPESAPRYDGVQQQQQ